jgi:hypothetical protein
LESPEGAVSQFGAWLCMGDFNEILFQ